jgi:hypothetical protein
LRFGDAEVIERRLQAPVVDQRNLDSARCSERLCQQGFHAGGHRRRIGLVADLDDVLAKLGACGGLDDQHATVG